MKAKIYKTHIKYLIAIIALGLFLRLLPDSHRLIWSYDQARDSFVMREMISSLDLKLIGPQTEHWGLFHGPLYYYLLAPFYFISKGNVGLPVFVMTLVTYSSTIPIFLLVNKISKSNLAATISLFIFSLSYQFIEYSRWLSNFTISIPLLCWSYYFYYLILNDRKEKKHFFLLGLTTGLAIQGELFLMSLALIVTIILVLIRTDFKNLLFYAIGGLTGVFPLVISEIRFDFRGTKILFEQVLGSGIKDAVSLKSALYGYLNHVGLTSSQTVSSINYSVGVIFFILILFSSFKYISNLNEKESKTVFIWLVSILLSHLILFKFGYVDAVFLDMGLAILIVVLTALAIFYLNKINRLFSFLVLFIFAIFQLNNYNKYVLGDKPFDKYNFIQEPSTLADKEQILDAIYNFAGDKPFTFSVIGTPFGVRTVWASVYEIYLMDHSVQVPLWYGYYAEGYPADDYFTITNDVGDLHVLILESNLDKLLSDRIIDEHLGNQNVHTKVDREDIIYDTRIQFRSPI
jgi:hypothetical protein